ncbi:MAG TPA: coniferyl aldehyde dehydrogenase [Longimicrobiales bacterium]|nr:coniferyl aldehyde dehydrogenase [Longimicrobiales bacterium]
MSDANAGAPADVDAIATRQATPPAEVERSQLHDLLDTQRAAFARGAPGYEQRMEALAALRDAVRARQDELLRAVSADFGGRAPEETQLLELFPLYDQIRHARRHLKGWMRRRRVRTSWVLWPSRAFYQYQPLGVVGVIGAWNYQLLLTLGPVVDAIAAGNHVILKPSEITPRSADVIARIIADAFAPEYIACVTGGPDVGAGFSQLPFDHLFFTGSTRVGTLVMSAAAAHLTPVTLELGGKSPAIVHDSYPFERAVQRIMKGKLLNAGQTCVAPDYVLLPERRKADFETEARRVVAELYPRLAQNADYTRIVNHTHLERLQALTEDAEAKGARVVTLGADGEATGMDGGAKSGEANGSDGGAIGADDRLFPPTLVFDTTDDMALMQEEIFGPILPVVTYRTLADAIAYVNARPHPLALYYFDHDEARVDALLAATLSGGVTINDCIYHLGQHNLPFGGVGASGMGSYHGFDGFQTFSKKRGVMVQSRRAGTSLLLPPYDAARRRLVNRLLKLALRSR